MSAVVECVIKMLCVCALKWSYVYKWWYIHTPVRERSFKYSHVYTGLYGQLTSVGWILEIQSLAD